MIRSNLPGTFALLMAGALFGAWCADDCAEFNALLKTTYGFKPSKLTKEEREAKSKEMDKVWDTVKANKAKLVPCLQKALQDPKADGFFLWDGSNLLVTEDDTEKSKTLQVSAYARADLGEVDPELFVGMLARHGANGLDTSAPAEKWLRFPKENATYYLAKHGAFPVTWDIAAVFIYSTMDEKFATPALLKVLGEKNHPGHQIALQLLCYQGTPEAAAALAKLDAKTLTPEEAKILDKYLKTAPLAPSAKPKVSREESVAALQELAEGGRDKFDKLIEREPECEADMVALLKPEDLPILRRARRRYMSRANQHVLENYSSFTKVITGLLARPGFK